MQSLSVSNELMPVILSAVPSRLAMSRLPERSGLAVHLFVAKEGVDGVGRVDHDLRVTCCEASDTQALLHSGAEGWQSHGSSAAGRGTEDAAIENGG